MAGIARAAAARSAHSGPPAPGPAPTPAPSWSTLPQTAAPHRSWPRSAGPPRPARSCHLPPARPSPRPGGGSSGCSVTGSGGRGPGRVNSGRQVNSARMRAVGPCSTRRLSNSSVEGSAQCRSSIPTARAAAPLRAQPVSRAAGSAASAARASGAGADSPRAAAARAGRQTAAHLRQRQAILHQEPFQFAQLLLGGSSRSKCSSRCR